MSEQQATTPETETLKRYLGKTLRVEADDGRVFAGQFKCTDRERNVILEKAHEHRVLPRKVEAEAQVQSRYVGLIVIPGKHIERIEVEEFDPALIL